jgi:type VI secretion system Hcp family effector
LFLAAGLVIAPPASAAVDSYLQIDGVPGESRDPSHPGAIELDSVQFGSLRRSAEIGSQTSGAGAGKVTFNAVTITKRVDKASPKLFELCTSGKHAVSATISMLKAGGSHKEYLVVKLHEVMLSSYRTSSAGGGTPTESFVLNAVSAALDYPGAPTTSAGARAVALAPGALQAVGPPRITGASASAANSGLGVTVTITSTGACQNAFVDYGDGSISEGHALTGTSTTLPAHTYPSAGAKTIKVGGRDAPYWPAPQRPQRTDANDCTGWAPVVNVPLRLEMAAPAPMLRK